MNLLTAIAIQQDYLWALVAFLWLGVLLAWWRRDTRSGWLPCLAVGGLAIAVIELSLLNTPVKPKPFIPSRLAWDVALGLTTWGMIAGLAWCSAVTRRGRLGMVVLLVGLTALGVYSVRAVRPPGEGPALHPRSVSPRENVRAEARVSLEDVQGWKPLFLARSSALMHGGGGWYLSGALLLTALAYRRRPDLRPLELACLVFVAVAHMVSSYGPLADALGIPRASTQLSLLGPWSAAVQVFAASLALSAMRGDWLRLPPGAAIAAEMGRLFWALALWVFLGFLLAAAMGAAARSYFENGALGRARAAALLIDTDLLARALGPDFRLMPAKADPVSSGRRVPRLEAPSLASGILQPLEKTLALIGEANPDVNQARLSTLRAGWLLVCCSPANYPGTRTNMTLLRPVTSETLVDWARRSGTITRPFRLTYGELSFATAPLVTTDGRMLGWLQLEFGASVWLASQAQARLLVFLIVGLGALLIALFFLQRWQARLRDLAQRAEAVATEADRAKTAFLAKVSHELRTPIQSILGYGELLATQPLPPDCAKWLGAQRSHSKLLIRLVNDLIDLSALQSGAFRLTTRNADLVDLVQGAVESLRPAALAKSLSLTCLVNPHLPRWWICDTERVRQIVLNLTGNAIKFTETGSVRVRLDPADPAAASQVRLLVEDTGPGIAAEDVPRLFRPFSRLDQSQMIEGSGLGLALSASLCTAMAGTLAVESDGCSGSTFIVRISLRPGTAPMPDRAAVQPTLAGQHILVVDDNALVRELFVSGLQLHGARCSTATDGLAALERAAETEFQAVVLDLSMPWLDGCETARRLRARPGPRSRIIGVSAHAGTEERERALAAGMDAFLIKPVELAALVEALDGQARPADLALDGNLLRRFREQFQLESAQLRAGLRAAAHDVPLLKRRVHYLKNSADVVRHTTLSSLCRELESQLAAADATAAPSAQHAALLAALDRELLTLDGPDWAADRNPFAAPGQGGD